MKSILTSSFLLLFVITNLYGQNIEKVVFNESTNDYYLSVPPDTEEIKGVLLLLPGFNQDAESIFPQSKLHNVAYLNEILTVAVAGGPKLYADETVIERLNQAVEHVMLHYKVAADSFIIGGFSAGGTISLRYTAYCYENKNQMPILPKAVFSVDSPVDLFHIWEYFDREIARNYSQIGVNEASIVKNIMINEIGDPTNQLDNYNELTPFKTDSTQPGNERFLKDLAVRVYHDIDVDWLISNRRRSLYDSNALPASELINRLVQQGNETAEFMQAKEPGIRSNGVRHPHSWSIVDEVELVQWTLKAFN